MPNPVDHKVKTRYEHELATDAQQVRVLRDVDHLLTFDPLAALNALEHNPLPLKGLLRIREFNASSGVPPARVKYDPLTLFIDSARRADASNGCPNAAYILSHELGHIIEHDGSAKAFSDEEAKRLSAWPKEERAEWQADTFADYVVLPLKFVVAFGFCRTTIALKCNVPMFVVERQIQRLREQRRYVGDPCPECANFTLVRNGTHLKCDTCGSTTGCS